MCKNSTKKGSIRYIILTSEVSYLAANKQLPDELIKLVGDYIDSNPEEFDYTTINLFRELLNL